MSNMMAPNYRTRSPFNDFFGAPFDMFAPGLMAAPPRKHPGHKHHRPLPTDIFEDKDAFTFAMELPGFARDEVTATIQDGVLTVKAVKESRECQKEEGEQAEKPTVLRKERFRCKTVSRSFFLGDGIDQDNVSAKLEDGILKVTVPKLAEQPLLEAHSIQIG